MDESRPFAGMEVVEFGQFIAVPFCAQLLAEGGAHVIKVESLDGDPVRHLGPLAPGETRHFISRNRGKHSLPLDLKHPRARAVIDRLLDRADVVLTNFRPGLAAELGLDWASLRSRYPALVVGNVSAFGPRGPDAGLAGMDLVIQARSGLMAAGGRQEHGVPTGSEAPVADYLCAMMLAFGIAAALLRRERTGRGGEVDVALLMAALVVQNNAMLRVERVDGPAHEAMRARLADLRAAGRPLAEQAAAVPSIRMPAMSELYYRTYATRDGAMAIACVSAGAQRALMRALGLRDTALDERITDRDAQARHYAVLRPVVEAIFASRTSAEWKTVLDEHGVPASRVALPVEMLDDPQALANGMLHDLPHPAVGTVRVLAPPVRIDGDGFQPAAATPPFGSEARAILAALGFAAADVEALLTAGVTRDRPAR
jgi:crotonobetainyl-CoA:carnitine CoA-transferase CaiB-like acyl-CoA transferase